MLISIFLCGLSLRFQIDTLKENKLAFNLSSGFHGEPSPSFSVSSVFGLRQLLIDVSEKSFTLSTTCDKANYLLILLLLVNKSVSMLYNFSKNSVNLKPVETRAASAETRTQSWLHTSSMLGGEMGIGPQGGCRADPGSSSQCDEVIRKM